MDIQTRKINFVQDFLKLENENIIALFENLLLRENAANPDFSPMTISEFQARIELSDLDTKAGKVTDARDLLSEIEKWS